MNRVRLLHALMYHHCCFDHLSPVLDKILSDHRYEVTITALYPGDEARLKKKGLKYSTDLSLFDDFIKDKRPKVLVLCADFNHPDHSVGRDLTIICKNLLIPTLSFQHGYTGGLRSYEYLFNASKMVFWSEKARSLEVNVNHTLKNKTIVLGCPRHDNIFKLIQEKKAKKFTRKQNYGIFFGTLIDIIPYYDKEKIIELLTDVFNAWKFFFPSIKVYVRIHPGDGVSKEIFEEVLRSIGLKYYIQEPTNSSDLYELISFSKFTISFGSTTDLESLLFSKPTLIFLILKKDKTSFCSYQEDLLKESKLCLNQKIYPYDLKIRQTIDDTFIKFHNIDFEKSFEKNLVKKYSYMLDGKSSRRAKLEIDKLIDFYSENNFFRLFTLFLVQDFFEALRRNSFFWLKLPNLDKKYYIKTWFKRCPKILSVLKQILKQKVVNVFNFGEQKIIIRIF